MHVGQACALHNVHDMLFNPPKNAASITTGIVTLVEQSCSCLGHVCVISKKCLWFVMTLRSVATLRSKVPAKGMITIILYWFWSHENNLPRCESTRALWELRLCRSVLFAWDRYTRVLTGQDVLVSSMTRVFRSIDWMIYRKLFQERVSESLDDGAHPALQKLYY